ncbi:MAG: tRNA (adenosine(37)-N6)-threonylcarbamoyltransferase complex transferase subunit TsaD [Ruminococcaceae bacterium]|nr:tRNA (adenosine(37)-N6)-threonylcarbamoyltransferase complex transferase subunit TsaD [Oscillospiraceae bacterium]
MLIFAIESSCDETAAAILSAEETENGHSLKLLSNVVSSQIAIHALYGGVVPEIASRAHSEAISGVAAQAFADAGCTPADIDAVAVTYAPGLIGSLLVGVSFAKAFATVNHLPLVPVNHIEAHVAAAYLTCPELKPPYLALVVSGGHTSLYEVSDYQTFTEIGGTRDDAAGEAFDKVGRVMGLPYPGGAAMDKLAAEGFLTYDPKQKNILRFPSPATPDETLDFSFSGLKTAVINHIHTTKQRMSTPGQEEEAELSHETKAEIAAAFTHSVTEGIAKKLDMALTNGKYSTVVMAGGVAANSHLRAKVQSVCTKHKVSFAVPPLALCGDNAAMTAACGYHLYRCGVRADASLNAFANLE